MQATTQLTNFANPFSSTYRPYKGHIVSLVQNLIENFLQEKDTHSSFVKQTPSFEVT